MMRASRDPPEVAVTPLTDGVNENPTTPLRALATTFIPAPKGHLKGELPRGGASDDSDHCRINGRSMPVLDGEVLLGGSDGERGYVFKVGQ